MSGFQTEMRTEPLSGADDKKKGRYPNPIIDLENAFIEIEGVEYRVADLLKLVVQAIKEK